MFVVSLHYKVSLEQINEALEAHTAFLDKYYQARAILVSGRKIPRTGGIIIANVENRADLDRMLDEDPFKQQGLADYEVLEFVPSRFDPGIADVFESGYKT